MVKVGLKIREARRIKRFTQEDLAKAIGVSDKSVSAYESDRITPPLKIIEKIAEKTDHTVSYFLEDNIEQTILAKLTDIELQFSEIQRLLRSKNKLS